LKEIAVSGIALLSPTCAGFRIAEGGRGRCHQLHGLPLAQVVVIAANRNVVQRKAVQRNAMAGKANRNTVSPQVAVAAAYVFGPGGGSQ